MRTCVHAYVRTIRRIHEALRRTFIARPRDLRGHRGTPTGSVPTTAAAGSFPRSQDPQDPSIRRSEDPEITRIRNRSGLSPSRLSAPKRDPRIALDAYGLTASVGTNRIFPTLPTALAAYRAWVRSRASSRNKIRTETGIERGPEIGRPGRLHPHPFYPYPPAAPDRLRCSGRDRGPPRTCPAEPPGSWVTVKPGVAWVFPPRPRPSSSGDRARLS